jgi:hypothetical protein
MAGACLVMSDGTDATPVSSITGDTNVVATEGTLTYEISFKETSTYSTLEVTYTAKLVNSSGTTQSSAVSPSSGTMYNGVPVTLTVTAPETAGTYTLKVTYTETIDEGTSTTTTDTVVITVKEPITLSVTLKNDSDVDLTGVPIYFYVDDKIIEDSKTTVTVKAGESTTVTYDWVPESLSDGSHTFKVLPDENAKIALTGLGTETSFYVGHTDYKLVTVIMGILLVVLVIFAIYVYRKPIKNYGKPKARR